MGERPHFGCTLSPNGNTRIMKVYLDYQSNLPSSNPTTTLFFAGKSGTTLIKYDQLPGL